MPHRNGLCFVPMQKMLKGKNGVLSERKYTEYARVSLALAAIGQNPKDVNGYD